MGKRLYVGNLPFNTTVDKLTQFFSQAGEVHEAKIQMDPTGRSRGFGFVEMKTDEEAQKAVETLNGKELDGRALTVNEARPMSERPPRRGGGGGFSRGGYGGGGYGGGDRF